VAVRLILPRRSDHPITDFARRSPLRSLHAAGAKVLLHGPGVLHAKITLIDGRAALVGSANLDRRSLFLNYEVGALIEDEGVMVELGRHVEGLAKESRRYDPARAHRAQRWDERLMEKMARLVANQL
jgi:cardiolipin synthase